MPPTRTGRGIVWLVPVQARTTGQQYICFKGNMRMKMLMVIVGCIFEMLCTRSTYIHFISDIFCLANVITDILQEAQASLKDGTTSMINIMAFHKQAEGGRNA